MDTTQYYSTAFDELAARFAPTLEHPQPHARHDFRYELNGEQEGSVMEYEGRNAYGEGGEGGAQLAMEVQDQEESYRADEQYYAEMDARATGQPWSSVNPHDPVDTAYPPQNPYADAAYTHYYPHPYERAYSPRSSLAMDQPTSTPHDEWTPSRMPHQHYLYTTASSPRVPYTPSWHKYIPARASTGSLIDQLYRGSSGDASSTYSLTAYNTPPTPRSSFDLALTVLPPRTSASTARFRLKRAAKPRPAPLDLSPKFPPYVPESDSSFYLPSPPLLPSPSGPSPSPHSLPTPSPPAPVDTQPHIPRPANSFILFRSHILSSKSYAPRTGENVSKIVGDLWHALPRSDRVGWEKLAVEEKERHRVEYPNYKYAPKKKADKKKRRAGGGGGKRVKSRPEVVEDEVEEEEEEEDQDQEEYKVEEVEVDPDAGYVPRSTASRKYTIADISHGRDSKFSPKRRREAEPTTRVMRHRASSMASTSRRVDA